MATTIAAIVPGGVEAGTDMVGTMMVGVVAAGGGGIAGIITITTVIAGRGTAAATIMIGMGIATAAGERGEIAGNLP